MFRRAARERERQLEEWQAIVRPLGHLAAIEDDVVVVRGVVVGRPFELDHRNGITYGQDVENGMRFRVEDEGARIAIATSGYLGIETVYGPRQRPMGDEAFDERFGVWANEAAAATLARLGPGVARLFVECHPHVEAYQGGGRAWIRFGARLERAHLEAAAGIVAGLWPPLA